MTFKPSNKKRRLKVFWATTLSLMFALTGCLILQTGALAQQSAKLFSAQEKVVVLMNNQNLGETNSLAENSTDIEELAQNLNFEKIGQVYYIRATENTALAK